MLTRKESKHIKSLSSKVPTKKNNRKMTFISTLLTSILKFLNDATKKKNKKIYITIGNEIMSYRMYACPN